MHPFSLLKVINSNQQLLLLSIKFQLIHNSLLMNIYLLLILSSNFFHESFVDKILVLQNVLILYFRWTFFESSIFNVHEPLPDRLVLDAEIKITIELKNIDFILKTAKMVFSFDTFIQIKDLYFSFLFLFILFSFLGPSLALFIFFLKYLR